MKPNDQAYQAAIDKYADTFGIDFSGSFENRVKSIVDAAYAAQFPPSEDYAGFVKELRAINTQWRLLDVGKYEELCTEAADALEALLAERDAMKAVVEIYEKKLNGIEDEIRLETQSAIAAVRPHIEAAEREHCVKAVEKVAEKINVAHHERPEWEDGYLQGVHDAAAAIRSGK